VNKQFYLLGKILSSGALSCTGKADRLHVMKAQRASKSRALLVLNPATRRDSVCQNQALAALFPVKDSDTV
jgi:hypothetical protein